jgi:hypothetical protein
VRSPPAPKPSTSVQNNASALTFRSRSTTPSPVPAGSAGAPERGSPFQFRNESEAPGHSSLPGSWLFPQLHNPGMLDAMAQLNPSRPKPRPDSFCGDSRPR